MPPENDSSIRKKMLQANHFFSSSVMFVKKSCINFNGYSENKNSDCVEDYDLWLKLGKIGKMKNLKTYSIKYYVHKNSISVKRKISQYKNTIYLIKKHKQSYSNYYKYTALNHLKLIIYGYMGFNNFNNIYLKIKSKSNNH